MGKNEPKVVTIVVNWNRCELLLDCVQSLSGSTHSNLKIIVVDNGSTDGSIETLKKQFPQVHTIENDTNLGFSPANNQGIEKAFALNADYIFFLNNDATVEPETVRRLVEFAEQSSQIGALSPFIYYAGRRNIIWFGGGKVALWRGWVGHTHLREDRRNRLYEPALTDYLTGCALMVRANLLREHGSFDESYAMYSEDVDLSLRLRGAGSECWVAPSATVYHQVSASAMGEMSPFKGFHRGRSNAMLFRRWARWYEWPTLALFGTFGALITSMKLLLTGKSNTALSLWRGIFNGLSGRAVPDRYEINHD